MNVDLKNRQQLLAVIAIGAIALLAGDRLLFTPLAARWRERSDQVAALRKSYAQGAQLLQRDKVLQSRWNTMLAHVLSNDVSAAGGQVYAAFDRWSQDSRVGITSIKPQWKRAAEDYATLECRVDASGSLPALTRFLYDIEHDPMALRIEDVGLTARDDNGQQLSLALQVSGLVLNPKQVP